LRTTCRRRSGDKSTIMPTHSEQIDQIRTKVQQLAHRYRTLETEHEKLKTELERRNETETRLRDRSQSMEKQLQLLKAASGMEIGRAHV